MQVQPPDIIIHPTQCYKWQIIQTLRRIIYIGRVVNVLRIQGIIKKIMPPHKNGLPPLNNQNKSD